MLTRYTKIFACSLLALSLFACNKPDFSENIHSYYAGTWQIQQLIRYTPNDTIYRDIGDIILKAEEDESSFNRLNYTDPSADQYILGLAYMREKAVIANDMYWHLDVDEKRFFLMGISPLKSWIQVYTIQEDEAEIKRNQEMTLFLDIRSPEVSGKETIILKKRQ